MREIEFTIDEEGNIEIDLQGFDGQGCQSLADKIAKALGKVTTREQKQEFYRPKQKPKQKISRR